SLPVSVEVAVLDRKHGVPRAPDAAARGCLAVADPEADQSATPHAFHVEDARRAASVEDRAVRTSVAHEDERLPNREGSLVHAGGDPDRVARGSLVDRRLDREV